MPALGNAIQTFITIFLGIFIEAVPFLLLGSLASGFIEVFVGREWIAKRIPSNPVLAALVGALMGFIFPVCECGVVPVTRRLFQKGLPLSVGVSFLLAAPIINPIVLASTWAAFGNSAVLWGRVGLSFLTAAGVGLIFATAADPQRLLVPALRRLPGPELVERPTSRSLPDHLRRMLLIAGEEFFDMGRYLVAGSLLAAAMQTLVPQSTLLQFGQGAVTSVLVMLLLAFLLSVCSTVDSFLALAFVNTFTTGSILAFLVFGPMVDIKSLLMFTGVFRRRVVLYLVLLPLATTLFLTVFVNLNLGL
jgi:uncharacterized membrane protein YraQ (UPF0718 family)